MPEGRPPKTIVIRTLQKGSGEVLEPGDEFVVNYRAFNYHSGKIEQSSWGKSTFNWVYGQGETVKAWEPGLSEMREGEWRELIAPSILAYGNGPLVYVVRLLKVEHR